MKTSTFLVTSLLALSLSACSATTGGVARSLANQAAVSAVNSSTAQSASVSSVQTTTPSADAKMTCAALQTEITETDAVIASSNNIISGNGAGNMAGQVAVTGASQAALHSGAAGTLARVPFGGLFAKTAMDSVANANQKKIDQAQADLQNANLRKATLSGLYAGKNCST